MQRKASKICHFKAGENIFSEGDEGNTLYLISEGTVELFRGDVLYRANGPGDALGVLSSFRHGCRTATAVAKTDVALEMVDRSLISDFLEGSDPLERKAANNLINFIEGFSKVVADFYQLMESEMIEKDQVSYYEGILTNYAGKNPKYAPMIKSLMNVKSVLKEDFKKKIDRC